MSDNNLDCGVKRVEKKSVPLSIRIAETLSDDIDRMMEKYDINKTEYVTRAITNELNRETRKFKDLNIGKNKYNMSSISRYNFTEKDKGFSRSISHVFFHHETGSQIRIRLTNIKHEPFILCEIKKSENVDEWKILPQNEMIGICPEIDDAKKLNRSTNWSWGSQEYIDFCNKYGFEFEYKKPNYLEEDISLVHRLRCVDDNDPWSHAKQAAGFALEVLNQDCEHQIESLQNLIRMYLREIDDNNPYCGLFAKVVAAVGDRVLKGDTQYAVFDFLPSPAGIGVTASEVTMTWNKETQKWKLYLGDIHRDSVLMRCSELSAFGLENGNYAAVMAEKLLQEAGIPVLNLEQAENYVLNEGRQFCLQPFARLPQKLEHLKKEINLQNKKTRKFKLPGFLSIFS